MLVEFPLFVVLVVMLVTKKSSLPTFKTAFWLLRVATRGVDKTFALPWVSRNDNKAEIIDLQDETGNLIGTKVVIQLAYHTLDE